jgi:hypothetical protein
MTVLSIVQQACPVIGLAVPTALFGQTDDTSVQLQGAINEVASMVAFDSGHDWVKLTATATITGDGASTAFNMPSDYRRMLKKARLWPSSSPFAPYTHYPDPDVWLGIQVQLWTPVIGAWTIIGSQINILPTLANAATVKYMYMQNTPVRSSGNAAQTQFLADNDTYLLGERLLKLAFIYHWKQNRGQDFSEALVDYQNSLAEHIGNDKGSKVLTVGQSRMPNGRIGDVAFPNVLGH